MTKTFEDFRKEIDEMANKPEYWVEAGDIIVPSGKFVHVFWNIINWQIAIKYEKKEDGGDRKMVLRRATELITASGRELARTVAFEFFRGVNFR